MNGSLRRLQRGGWDQVDRDGAVRKTRGDRVAQPRKDKKAPGMAAPGAFHILRLTS